MAAEPTTDTVTSVPGYAFRDPSLLREALTHASIAGSRLESNERMEFLGDAVLGFVVSRYLYDAFPREMEGELTKIKGAVVSRRVCAQISRKLGLDEMMNLGKGMGGRRAVPRSIAAAAFESVIAAVYLDGGIEAASEFILGHVRGIVHRTAESAHQFNFKSVLQQYAQRELGAAPTYLLLDEKGPDHSKAFEVCVEIEGRRFESAWANSKKEAEQKTALGALQELGLAEVRGEEHVVLIGDAAAGKDGAEVTLDVEDVVDDVFDEEDEGGEDNGMSLTNEELDAENAGDDDDRP